MCNGADEGWARVIEARGGRPRKSRGRAIAETPSYNGSSRWEQGCIGATRHLRFVDSRKASWYCIWGRFRRFSKEFGGFPLLSGYCEGWLGCSGFHRFFY